VWNQSSVVLLVGALLKSFQTLSLLIPKLPPWSQLKIFSIKGSNKGGVGSNSPRLAIGNQTTLYTCTHVHCKGSCKGGQCCWKGALEEKKITEKNFTVKIFSFPVRQSLTITRGRFFVTFTLLDLRLCKTSFDDNSC
jgi:hypothetical protein